jgi:hypothetical protein
MRVISMCLLALFVFAAPGPAAHAQSVYGAIGDKYAALGGNQGPLGAPTSDEMDAPYGGRFNSFQYGYIYWHPEIGAFAVWGAIAEKWNAMGRVEYGYPITDESVTPDGRGRYNHFRAIHQQRRPESSIYWTPETGAHAIYGAIRDAWAAHGWERGELGYPTSDERQDGQFRVTDFEHGFIVWSAAGGAAINTASTTARCNAYADRAVAQAQEYFARGCGPASNRWQENWQAHFNFCMGPDGDIADRETSEREGLLSQCRTVNPLPGGGQPAPAGGACNVSVVVRNDACLNLDGTLSAYVAPGSLTALGCGADQNAALAAAKASFSSQAALADDPTPGACTYTVETTQGCLCR